MLVIEKKNFSLHNPSWKFTLGPETYETKDTPKRVEAIKKALAAEGRFKFKTARRFQETHLSRIHPYHDYIKKTSQLARRSGEEFYPDLFPGEGAMLERKIHPLWGGVWCTDAVTPIMGRTYEVARGSAEAAMTGAAMLLEGTLREVYALCRPSGHHAGPRVFGGYCYFNNVVAAAELLAPHGPVAILDIDYHHGNGNQEFFYERRDVFTCSIHGDPGREYPYFWGYRGEKGRGQGTGANLNLPLPLGSDDEAYLAAVDRAMRAIRRFKPAYLIVGAGFDTHADDPIGGFALATDVYSEIGRRIGGLSVPLLVCQEGGYNLDVLGGCAARFLTGLADARSDQPAG
jgi:acetoin utilization deacetylase AcuC-like enzyme